MVQFTIAYVALGFAVLLVLGGIFAVLHRANASRLSPSEQVVIIGGLSGMAVLIATAFWLRR